MSQNLIFIFVAILLGIASIAILVIVWKQSKDFQKEVAMVLRIVASSIVLGLLTIVVIIIKSLVMMAVSGLVGLG